MTAAAATPHSMVHLTSGPVQTSTNSRPAPDAHTEAARAAEDSVTSAEPTCNLDVSVRRDGGEHANKPRGSCPEFFGSQDSGAELSVRRAMETVQGRELIKL